MSRRAKPGRTDSEPIPVGLHIAGMGVVSRPSRLGDNGLQYACCSRLATTRLGASARDVLFCLAPVSASSSQGSDGACQ